MTIITHKGKVRNGAVTPMFISKWDTTQAGSANDTVVLPLVSDGNYDFFVDWGDGNRENITAYNQSEVTHQYSSTGIYEIKIHGDITGWDFDNAGDDDKITEISKWGPLKFVSNDGGLFNGCSNLDIIATDILTLGASNGNNMFENCVNLGSGGNMNAWDTSSLTSMRYMFSNTPLFNQEIGSWDVGNVTSFFAMFYPNGGAFNNGGSSSISGWDTSSATDMGYMFYNCDSFNQDIGNWDVANVTNMGVMLASSNNFNNGGSPSISGWDTSSVTQMNSMFQCTGFNQPIGNWDTSSVTSMRYMFSNASLFNQEIGLWDVGNVISFFAMFYPGGAFNNGGSSSISGWDTSSATNIDYMFYNCDSFDQDLSNWTVTGITSASNFMNGANGLSTTNYDRTLSGWSSQLLNNSISINFGGSQYSTATGLAYRNALVASGWTITDGGAV